MAEEGETFVSVKFLSLSLALFQKVDLRGRGSPPSRRIAKRLTKPTRTALGRTPLPPQARRPRAIGRGEEEGGDPDERAEEGGGGGA